MDKKLTLKLSSGDMYEGCCRPMIPLCISVMDECVETAASGQQNNIGLVITQGKQHHIRGLEKSL
ncbi:hypothetical protein ACRRTK_024253 [Alexandromys fortis]